MNDMTRVIRDCQRAGLRFVHGRKHGKIVDPRTGRFVVVSSTASCMNAHKRVLQDIRRFLGVNVAPE